MKIGCITAAIVAAVFFAFAWSRAGFFPAVQGTVLFVVGCFMIFMVVHLTLSAVKERK